MGNSDDLTQISRQLNALAKQVAANAATLDTLLRRFDALSAWVKANTDNDTATTPKPSSGHPSGADFAAGTGWLGPHPAGIIDRSDPTEVWDPDEADIPPATWSDVRAALHPGPDPGDVLDALDTALSDLSAVLSPPTTESD